MPGPRLPGRHWLTLLLALFVTVGCRPAASDEPSVELQLRFEPSPPEVGQVRATATLRAVDGQPLKGAKIALEGNMNHAGMKPSFAVLAERDPGVYTGELEFTMGGDWFVLATVTLADGSRVERQIDVPGVAAR